MTQQHLRITTSKVPDDIAKLADRTGTNCWIILESYPSLTFKEWRPGEPLHDLGDEFAGRIFGELGELRWTRDGHDFDLWLFEDTAQADDLTTLFQVKESFYYGLGYWKNNCFSESTLTLSKVDYPPCSGVKDGDRPRFKVLEYFRTTPAKWPTNVDEFEKLINQPSLAAYRLVAFDAGRDGA